MNIVKTPLQYAYIIETEPFVDHRGKFARIYCHKELEKIGHHKRIVQINHSLTRQKGAIRGMHFQYPPKAESKIVKCLSGSVFDVIIDLRRYSPTLLQWHGAILSAENMKMMYIPAGFAHGLQTLEENTELLYLHTEFYSPEHEGAVRYDDPLIDIEWPLEVTDISVKDRDYPLLPQDFEGIDFS
ncbi:MAG: dTDP-4-dehydrorhamnose 3,5-epimerase [Desulfobacterales bacterium]|nr:dTDP-4-dehydrorhamnose 3,5-epimerase [Desulfobacterales bacterium]